MTEGEKKVDEDWKRRAHEETAKASKPEVPKEQPEGAPAASGTPGERSPFMEFINAMATEALVFLGAVAHPQTGQPVFHPEQAKQTIDILGLLEEKTKGNLTPDEAKMIKSVVHELRMAFVEATQGPGPGAPPAPPPNA